MNSKLDEAIWSYMTLSGKLIDDKVIMDRQAVEELYATSFYGRQKGDALELSLTESAFLLYMGKISILSGEEELDFKQFFLRASSIVKNFELLYIVYKDMRERGYYIQPSVTGFRVYPRGGHPGKTPAEFFVFVTSERIPLLLSDLRANINTVENLKKRLILAIVDEESDITYYEVKRTALSGSCELKLGRSLSVASLLEDRVMVWEPEISRLLHSEWFFGRPMDEGHLQLSLVESCYLLNKGMLGIEQRDHEALDPARFSALASSIEPDFLIKYRAYEKLRDSGLVPKTGFKFGTHFRVYKTISSISSLQHSDYLIHAVAHDHVFLLQQLSRAARLANSVRKEMIYAAVNGGVEFIVIGRVRL